MHLGIPLPKTHLMVLYPFVLEFNLIEILLILLKNADQTVASPLLKPETAAL